MGQVQYTPLKYLKKAYKRRDLVEDLTQLTVFYRRNSLSKGKIGGNGKNCLLPHHWNVLDRVYTPTSRKENWANVQETLNMVYHV